MASDQRGQPQTDAASGRIWVVFWTLAAAAGLLMATSWAVHRLAASWISSLFVLGCVRVGYWIVYEVLFGAMIVCVGLAINRRADGVLISSRNRVSLSRLQFVAWTVVIVPALPAAAGRNLAIDGEPLAIKVPAEIWLMLGVQTTALIGSPVLLANKGVALITGVGAAARLAVPFEGAEGNPNISAKPAVVRMDAASEAKWSNLFTGEETSNFRHVDMSRLQLFFFNLAALPLYAAAVWLMLLEPKSALIESFPAVSPALAILMGASNAGYLLGKLVPKNKG